MEALPRTAVLVSTYNWPWALERVLVGLARQTVGDFEVVVGDDGSSAETAERIKDFRKAAPFPIEHVWQEDRGFRRAGILNAALRSTDAELLVFLDQDGIPAANLLELHRDAFAHNRLVVGGYIRLTREQSKSLTLGDVASGAFEPLMSRQRRSQLRARHRRNLLYIATRRKTRPKIMGLNFSVSRDLVERVNGFDEDYEGWGKEDSDLRTRMRLAGGGARCLWHQAFVYHLWHPIDASKPENRNRSRYLDLTSGRRPTRCIRGLRV